jgi:hypothetical protein
MDLVCQKVSQNEIYPISVAKLLIPKIQTWVHKLKVITIFQSKQIY